MKKSTIVVAATLIAGLAYPAGAQNIRAKAELVCEPTKESLKYDCRIKLVDARTNAPLTGVTLTVGADMPSMPGAHNVRPVTAEAQADGTYRALLELEMTGVWAVQLNIAGATRDRIVKVLRFGDDQAAQEPPHKHQHKHQHQHKH
jgi:nitrogen fixation protein FixH